MKNNNQCPVCDEELTSKLDDSQLKIKCDHCLRYEECHWRTCPLRYYKVEGEMFRFATDLPPDEKKGRSAYLEKMISISKARLLANKPILEPLPRDEAIRQLHRALEQRVAMCPCILLPADSTTTCDVCFNDKHILRNVNVYDVSDHNHPA